MRSNPPRRFPALSLAVVALLFLSTVPMPVEAAPSITGISRSSGTTNGGIFTTINGVNFDVASVTFGGTSASITASTSTSVTVIVPPRATSGTVNVVVTNEDSTSAQFTNGFAYNNAGTPTITGLSDNAASTNGGTTTTLQGTNFFFPNAAGSVGIAIRIGNFLPYDITPVTCSPAIGSGGAANTGSMCTEVSFKVPAHSAGAQDIVVTNPDGKTVTRTGGFTYTNPSAPTITGVAPISASSDGGATLTITGTNFASGAIVRVGGAIATVDSFASTAISVTVPPHAPGTVDVSVTNPNGDVASSSGSFTYNPEAAPGLAASPASPNVGPVTGGSFVTITGTGFHADAQFTFDGLPAHVLSVAGDGLSAQVVTPPHAAGDVAIRVTNPDGKSAVRSPTSSQSIFTYTDAVRITSIPINEASRNGGQAITIHGQGFVSGAKVYFVDGSTQVESPSASFSGGNLQVTVPASMATTFSDACHLTKASGDTPATNCRQVDIRVENPLGDEAWLIDGFTYKQAAAPAFATSALCTTASGTCTAAAAGSENGGQKVFVRGSNFHTNPKPTVTIGGEEATVGAVTATSIEVTVPPSPTGAGPVDLVVTNPGGQFISRTYTYENGPVPSISSLSSSTDTQNGGKSITITGSNFHTNPKPTVLFGTVEATVGSVTATSIQVTVPPRTTPGDVPVTVRNPGGNENLVTPTFSYTAATAPTITSVNQATASVLGGATLTITGTNFHTSPRPTVTFAGVEAAVNSASATSLQVTVPAGTAAGGVTIGVTNPGGQAATLAGQFAYTAATSPQVTSVAPQTGPAGTEVTITGTNFARPGPDADPDDSNFPPRPAVTIGGVAVPAADVTPVSGTSIKFIVPNSVAIGTPLTITVTNPDGASGPIGNAFTVPAAAGAPPEMTGVSPCSVTTNGGTATVTGTGFNSGAAVLFGAVPARVAGFSTTSVAVDVLASAASGQRTVTLINPDGQSVGIYNACMASSTLAPTLQAWSPTAGPANGGTLVKICGDNMLDGTTAIFGGFTAQHVLFEAAGACPHPDIATANVLTVRAPAHAAGVADLTIVNPDGKSVSIDDGVAFVGAGGPAAATVTAVSPNSGPSLGGTSVTITGTGFAQGATVSFGGTAATSVVVGSTTSITATTPAHAAGAVTVSVTNPGATAANLANGFTYTASPAPTVTSIAPTSGSTNGGTSVTITGTNFASGATVTFGGTAATSVTFNSATSLTAVSPARSTAGAVDVVVKNPDNQEGTLDDGFTYEAAPAPTVTSLSPTQGPSVGGTSVTITGTNFANGAKVTFGGRESTTVAVASNGNSLTATTPGHPAGQVAVVVTNPDDQSGTLSNAFTYTASPAPTISSVTPTSGPTAGGTSITIAGTGFASGAQVRVGGAAATDVTVTPTQITAKTPAGTAGAKTVQVINPDDQTASLTGAFTYGSSSTPTPAQIEAANERLQGSVDVSREDGDNVITYSLSGISPDPVGIQVWRSTSPFAVIATLDGADARSGEYVDQGAPENAYYILTVFYSRDADGGFVSTLADAPGYEGTSEDEQRGMAATIPESGGSSWWIWVIVAVVILAVVVVIIVAVANRRREPEVYDRDVGWVDKEWNAPPSEDEPAHRITCPRCSTTFEAKGQRPLTTHCPNCGVQGTLT